MILTMKLTVFIKIWLLLFVKVQGSQKRHFILEPGRLGNKKNWYSSYLIEFSRFSSNTHEISRWWLIPNRQTDAAQTLQQKQTNYIYLVVRLIDKVRLKENPICLLKYWYHHHHGHHHYYHHHHGHHLEHNLWGYLTHPQLFSELRWTRPNNNRYIKLSISSLEKNISFKKSCFFYESLIWWSSENTVIYYIIPFPFDIGLVQSLMICKLVHL